MLFERERPSHFGVYRDAAFLSRCEATQARKWIRSRAIEFGTVFGVPETPANSHVLEYILFRRNEPLIDLELAEKPMPTLAVQRCFSVIIIYGTLF